ncbi:hypothetical protein [Shewanella xiamenensis]|uniref:hypothetical protein n=1 Tax=Shewanella xiamenensis TaxID=332186 RepID=UPI0021BE30CE|nr:hypothetical protein [Shewanella xiamenensis]MCT8876898.1 hypothetical protein [Shewanella xiamenensis]
MSKLLININYPLIPFRNLSALFSMYCILLMPVFSNYVFIGEFSFGDVLFFLSIPWLVLNFRYNSLNSFQILLCFCLLFISLIVFSLEESDNYFGKVLRAAFYYTSFFIIAGQRKYDYSLFFRHYVLFSLTCSFAIIVQWCLYHILGLSVPFQLPIAAYEPDTLTQLTHVYRSGGFFKEPSYFAIFVTPIIFYFALERRYFYFVFLCVAGIMSTSTLFLFIILLSVFFFPRRDSFFIIVTLFLCLFIMLLYYDGLFDNSIFLVRFISIFTDGGTLNDRFLPVMNLISSSDLFYSKSAVQFILTSGFWFSSVGAILAYLGFFCLLFISISFYRFGIFFGCICFIYMLTTHYLSSVYSPFVFFSIFSLRLLLRDKKNV